MIVKKDNNGLKVKEGKRTEITVSHLDKDLTFFYPNFSPRTYEYIEVIYPNFSPYTYAILKSQFESVNLTISTAAQTISLIYAAYQYSNDELHKKYSKEIKSIMKNRWFWMSGNLYTKKGVYVQDNPEIIDSDVFMDEIKLIKKLESNDLSVRFVPYGYRTGEQSSLELSKNPFIIAHVGEEGAEKLSEITSKHKLNPDLSTFKSLDQLLITVSALNRHLYNDRLVFSSGVGLYSGGFAFGVR